MRDKEGRGEDHGRGRAHRWVTHEPEIPFDLPILYADASIIVVDKPHFLATTPRGMWYRQTALIRLREQFGDERIVPAHRLDRMTAGVVLFVREPNLRGAYQTLFQEHRAVKTYECLAPAAPLVRPPTGTVACLDPPSVFPLRRRSHIVKERGRLQAYEVPGMPNAETDIELAHSNVIALKTGSASVDMPCLRGSGASVNTGAGGIDTAQRRHVGRTRSHALYRRYVLHPRTGKTHQLRVHMSALGLPIVGDDMYPELRTRAYDDFSQPLELVARSLEFSDPVTGAPRCFLSSMPLGMSSTTHCAA